MSRGYVLISPCRDEAAYMRRTIDSVAAQTLPPALWVVVDDGSTDETPRILEEAASRLPYLRVVRRDDRGGRRVGPGVVEAFNAGLATIDIDDFDYVCKLDLDLELPARYFERLVELMEADGRLGSVSGKPFFIAEDGRLVSEAIGDEVSAGMTKFYRTSCFREIGGLVPQVMWDGIDCHRCRMLGWKAASVDGQDLRFTHLRAMGSSHKSIWTGRTRHGAGQWFMGTGPVYMTASAAFRMTRPPLVVGGLAMWWGYVRSALAGAPRYEDREFRAFLREFQWDALRRGKREATRRLDDRQEPLFRGRVAT